MVKLLVTLVWRAVTFMTMMTCMVIFVLTDIHGNIHSDADGDI